MKNLSSHVKAQGTPNGIPTGIDWAAVDYKSCDGLGEAISGYFKEIRAKATRPGHLTLPVAEQIDARVYGPAQDNDILSLFRYVDKRGSKNSVYKFAHSSAGMVFEQKKPGQAAKIRSVSEGTPGSVESVTWDGGLGIDDEVVRFDDYGTFEQNVQAVPAISDDHDATMASALFGALGAGVNETWVTDLITTINNGCAQIMETVGDQYGLSDNAEFGLLYNHRQAALVRQALVSNLTLANSNNSKSQLEFNILPVKTRKIANGALYLMIPGYDLVEVEWDSLFSEMGRNVRQGADEMVWKKRRNAAIGNVNQIRRITPQ